MHNSSKKRVRYYGLLVCSIAILFYFFDYFIQVSPSIMTKQLMENFHIEAAGLGVLAAFFYYAYLLMQMPAGILLDKFGARKMITIAILLCAVGTVLVGYSHQRYLAYLGRALTGIGSAFSFVGAVTLIADWFADKYFATLMGITQSGAALGSMFGLVLLSQTTQHYGWRQTLFGIAILTVILGVLSCLFIRNRQQHDTAKQTLGSIKHLFQVLHNKQLWFIAIVGFCSWVPVATIGALWGVPFLSKVFQINTVKASELCSVFWIGLGVMSPLIGWCSDRCGQRKLFLALCFLIGLVSSILLISLHQQTIWLSGLLLFGLSFASSAQSLSFAVVKAVMHPNHLGYASGFNNMAAIIGGACAQSAVGFLLRYLEPTVHGYSLANYSIAAYTHALLVMPIALLIGLVVILFFIDLSESA